MIKKISIIIIFSFYFIFQTVSAQGLAGNFFRRIYFSLSQQKTEERTADYYSRRLEELEKKDRQPKLKQEEEGKLKADAGWQKKIESLKIENYYLTYQIINLQRLDPGTRKKIPPPDLYQITYLPVNDPEDAKVYRREKNNNDILRAEFDHLTAEQKRREDENKIPIAPSKLNSLRESAVAIVKLEAGRFITAGTGVMIKNPKDESLVYVFTAGHVVDGLGDKGYAVVYDAQGKIKNYYPLKKVWHEQQTIREKAPSWEEALRDFAVLAFKPRRADELSTVSLAYRGYRPIYNQKVLGFGCGGDVDHPSLFGDNCQILSYDELQPGWYVLKTRPATRFGDSGGPLFDSQGRLLGIATSANYLLGIMAYQGVFIPSENIWKMLDEAGFN